MNKVLWLLQVLLALAFLAHGILLLFPPADMVAQMNASMSTSFRLFLGAAEVVAAVGLTLPGMTGIQLEGEADRVTTSMPFVVRGNSRRASFERRTSASRANVERR